MKTDRVALIDNTDFSLYNFWPGIIRALITRGRRVSIICPDGPYIELLKKEGVAHHALHMDRKGTNPFHELRTLWQLYRLLKKEKFDLVHTFTVKPNIYGSIAAGAAGTPIIINSVTGMGYVFIESGGVKRWILRNLVANLYRFALKFSKRVIFLNRDDFELFQKHGIIDSQKGFIMRCGSGVDTKKFSSESVNPDRVRRYYVR